MDGHPYSSFFKTLNINGDSYKYVDVTLFGTKYDRLPYSIRVLLESCTRNCNGLQISQSDVEKVLDWKTNQEVDIEISYKPSRVILPDITAIPALVDLAAMREAVKRLEGDPSRVNPVCRTDVVVDHSVQVDFYGSADALAKNESLEFERNKERFKFLKWGAKTFDNMLILPSGSGIIHQLNLEYLSHPVVLTAGVLHPDTVVGGDSHTGMVGGMGVLAWGVGGIEAEAVMLGQPISMLLPQVVGYKLIGQLRPWVTSTDLILTITEHLRSTCVVGKFVEFFGPAAAGLSVADRATIANMSPEYGATAAFFPADEALLSYLRVTNRSEENIAMYETYLRAVKLFRDYNNPNEDPEYSEVHILDLSKVETSVSGPKRPQDRVPVTAMRKDFRQCLLRKVGLRGYGLTPPELASSATFELDGKTYSITHGSVIIAAITSCTNTSNPSVMLGAGILAKGAVERGLGVLPYVKTSLSPGSKVVSCYLKASGLTVYLEQLGFHAVGYGCMTCMGNSGPLHEGIAEAVDKANLICCSVLSGNRNFEGRIHPHTRANYLASPLLVIAYALAGTVDIDFETQPLGFGKDGAEVYLRDIWPTRAEIDAVERQFVVSSMFKQVYENIELGSPAWRALEAPNGELYAWDEDSTYIVKPPFFDHMMKEAPPVSSILNARCLVWLGDSVTTDHISPAGAIARNCAAAKYLGSKGLTPKSFNSYGSRWANHEVMTRATFGNIRLVNKMAAVPGPKTTHYPSGEDMGIYEASRRYASEGIPLVLLAGREYGSGSSRDWSAKGPYLLGVKAVLAESFERIHRFNLVGMGVVPLQFSAGQNAEALGLTGEEIYSIDLRTIGVGKMVEVKVEHNQTVQCFEMKACIDTELELDYFRNGGILNYMVRKMV